MESSCWTFSNAILLTKGLLFYLRTIDYMHTPQMTSTEAKWITTVWRTVFDLITLFMHRSQHTQLDYYAKFLLMVLVLVMVMVVLRLLLPLVFLLFFLLFCNPTEPTGLSNNTHIFITISFSSERIPTLELMRILLLLLSLLLSVCFKFSICSRII